jgi:hypothetical protein
MVSLLSLRAFENSVLRGIFERKRVELIGGRRELHNAELHGLFTSPNIIKTMKSSGVK